ncbi:hypothetical protein EMIHUDRAFT_371909 [Emiliania huxleyi CCMP1516]|uniref:TFIIS N-terminal domain-containing protein n=2 Tax=Emiliania huxleyi TaxID=2903 RepID=A0A0D3IBU8_EMIH1|nr:hypothetical protein EMIHUDRAFT_371909 [Emiliania huxleyi CCMP1516]EOD08733.1 hypothetical protein EMIHUDRAFT_371909 [Emiliania huxleyi CCMP1516]|eukprot:XP_005761162.1 hypothetical protein EMIHUDRAFT_371909 [Emiliania huxleyi CCMP1516]
MESLLRDLGDARDACNNLPFDDALRDKIATELDRIEAAPPLERMLVTKPPVKRWAELVSQQKDPSIKTRRQAALTAILRVVDRLPARGPSQEGCAALVEIDGRALGSAAMLEGARAGEASAGEASGR